MSAADLNGDGLTDVVVSHWNSHVISVLLQNSRGTLDAAVNYDAQNGGYDEIDTSDVNRDGDADVVLMSGQLFSSPNLSVYLQDRTFGILKSFVTYNLGNQILTNGFGIGDLNRDGRKDLVVSFGGNRPASHVGVLLQRGDGSLEVPLVFGAYDIPESVEVADVNGDGKDDVLVLHGGWNALSVYLQQAALPDLLAPYQLSAIPYASHYQPQGLAVGDINTDGSPDAVIADYGHGLVLLLNAKDSTIYVDQATRSPAPNGSKLSPYTSLAAAIEAASKRQNGAIIKVAVGVYADVTTITPGIRIYGGYKSSVTPSKERWNLQTAQPTTLLSPKDRQVVLHGDHVLNNVVLRGHTRVE